MKDYDLAAIWSCEIGEVAMNCLILLLRYYVRGGGSKRTIVCRREGERNSCFASKHASWKR